ncbi:hypothetical protein LTR27_005488 [Elasticomyces elasticus]|nr:hypothetical protein LTR27_005488 [Elasticomyces elasticus]
MYLSLTALLLSFTLSVPIVSAQTPTDIQFNNYTAPTATIRSGALRGKSTQLPGSNVTVNQFLGVPFARPPLEGLRFAHPQEPSPWERAYDASKQPPACIQWRGPPGPATDFSMKLFYNPPPPAGSEDCLYLNVFTPSGGEANKSVLFWIYGGSGIAGAASQPIYDGTSFAANHDIIVVAANYRLSVFGNPKSAGLPLSERNLNLLDQQLALNWTQQNIAAFGGDPEKVTIMGESAGAVSVGTFINTYAENPPFRAGVQMSGSSIYTLPSVEGGTSDDEWRSLTELLNCTNTSEEELLECVRAVDADTIMQVLERNNLRFTGFTNDNVTVHERPDTAWANRHVARVPIMVGSTANDASVFVMDVPVSNISVGTLLQCALGSDSATAELIASMYAPGSPYAEGANTTQDVVSQIATDFIFRCTSGLVANLTSTLLNVPVWQYVFDAQVPSNTWEEYPDLGVYHASEVSLLFGTYPRENSTEVEAKLSRSVQKQFADFVKNPEQGPGWEQWPQVGILGVNDTDAVTTTQAWKDLDAVCLQYNDFYLSTLPALTRMNSSQSNGSGTGASDNIDSVVPNAADRLDSSAIWIGASLLGLAALL